MSAIIKLQIGVPPFAGPDPDFPATLAATGWWRGYTGAIKFTGTASAGSSGGNDLDEIGGSRPAVGAALNGHGVDDYTPASGHKLIADDTVATYFDEDGYGGWVLLYVDAITTDVATANGSITNVCVVGVEGGGGGYFQISLRSNGGSPLAVFSHYSSGSLYDVATCSIATGAWTMLHWRFTGSQIEIGTNGTWGTPVLTGNLNAAVFGVAFQIEFAMSDTGAFFDGKMADRQLFAFPPLDADIDGIKTYINDRYGLSL